MKKIEMKGMEDLKGGKIPKGGLASCGQAIVLGMMFGTMFGPAGEAVALVGVVLGGNCLAVF